MTRMILFYSHWIYLTCIAIWRKNKVENIRVFIDGECSGFLNTRTLHGMGTQGQVYIIGGFNH